MVDEASWSNEGWPVEIGPASGSCDAVSSGALVRRAMRNFAERARLFLMRSASIGTMALRLRSSNVGAGASKTGRCRDGLAAY
jgi:hypothetical protein